jgi:large subunit ribosomal protein L19
LILRKKTVFERKNRKQKTKNRKLSPTFAVRKKSNNMNAVAFVHEQLDTKGKAKHPAFKAGDNITVNYKILEGNKERIQSFKGDVIKRQGTGATSSFTVRKVSDGIGVERLFPFFSPNIDSIILNKVGKVSRAKLYYLRERSGKSARIREKRMAVAKK